MHAHIHTYIQARHKAFNHIMHSFILGPCPQLSTGKERYIQKFEMDKVLSERGSLILYLEKVCQQTIVLSQWPAWKVCAFALYFYKILLNSWFWLADKLLIYIQLLHSHKVPCHCVFIFVYSVAYILSTFFLTSLCDLNYGKHFWFGEVPLKKTATNHFKSEDCTTNNSYPSFWLNIT